MARLNIQLSRHIQTTRRPRWVVWLSMILFLFTCITTYFLSNLWFAQDKIYKAAPTETVVALRFFTGGSKQNQIASLFQNIPLISNRALEYQDIKNYINGEFAVFIKVDGSRSVAIRTKKPFPQTLFDSQYITKKQIEKDLFLLSENSVQTETMHVASKFFSPLPFTKKTWIGEIVLADSPKRGMIYDAKDQMILSFPERNTPRIEIAVPENTFAFFINASNDANKIQNSSVFLPFLPLIQSVIGNDLQNALELLSGKIDRLELTKDQNGIGFLLSAKQSTQTPFDVRLLLQSISALNSPKIEKKALVDNTPMQEIIADPNAVSIEHVTIFGTPMLRVQKNNESMFAGSETGHLLLTNREELIGFAKESVKKKQHTICDGNVLGVSLDEMNLLRKARTTFLNISIFEQFGANFSSFGIKNKLYSTEVHFCKK